MCKSSKSICIFFHCCWFFHPHDQPEPFYLIECKLCESGNRILSCGIDHFIGSIGFARLFLLPIISVSDFSNTITIRQLNTMERCRQISIKQHAKIFARFNIFNN